MVSGDGTGRVNGVLFGPQKSTLRDLSLRYRWDGLSAGDAEVLGRFISAVGVTPDELHTHVPVGGMPDGVPATVEAACPGMAGWLYPRRVDAAMRFGGEWWIAECKPDSRPGGLGQCLCYWYWWCRDVAQCPCSRVLLLCGLAQLDEAAVYRACGVEVVQV